MEKIEGVDLTQLVTEAATELVNSSRKQATDAIKIHLQ